jgi:hypothetical protein
MEKAVTETGMREKKKLALTSLLIYFESLSILDASRVV